MSNSTSVFNPKSNRFIKIDGASFKKLLKDDKYTFVDNTLTPPDSLKSEYRKLTDAFYQTSKYLFLI